MHFVRSEDSSNGQNDLLAYLNETLKTKSVFYLLSGGSNIKIETDVLNLLDSKHISNLKLLLVDERYGPKGHRDSNYASLVKAGLDVRRLNFPDILANNLSAEETTKKFSDLYQEFKHSSDTSIGQLGIGSDGHIAGILPNSPAVSSNGPVICYESTPYKRMTLSLKAIKDMDKVFVFCFGKEKLDALNRLKSSSESLSSLPSMVLKEMTDVTVYNDQVTEG